MWHAMRGWDGRGPATALGDAVAAHFGLASVRDVAVALHKGVIAEDGLIKLTGVLFAVAAGGDAVARSLVEKQATEICLMAVAAMRRLGMAPAGVPVVLGGGVLESREPLLLEAVHRELAAMAPGAAPGCSTCRRSRARHCSGLIMPEPPRTPRGGCGTTTARLNPAHTEPRQTRKPVRPEGGTGRRDHSLRRT